MTSWRGPKTKSENEGLINLKRKIYDLINEFEGPKSPLVQAQKNPGNRRGSLTWERKLGEMFSLTVGILTQEIVRAMSTMEVVTGELYEKDGSVKTGGLLDPRMGVSMAKEKCEICKEKDDCKGHFGHFELLRPYFHPDRVPKIVQIMNMFCIYCNAPLFPIPSDETIRTTPHTALFNNAVKALKLASNRICKNSKCCDLPQFEFKKGDGSQIQMVLVKNNKNGVKLGIRKKKKKKKGEDDEDDEMNIEDDATTNTLRDEDDEEDLDDTVEQENEKDVEIDEGTGGGEDEEIENEDVGEREPDEEEEEDEDVFEDEEEEEEEEQNNSSDDELPLEDEDEEEEEEEDETPKKKRRLRKYQEEKEEEEEDSEDDDDGIVIYEDEEEDDDDDASQLSMEYLMKNNSTTDHYERNKKKSSSPSIIEVDGMEFTIDSDNEDEDEDDDVVILGQEEDPIESNSINMWPPPAKESIQRNSMERTHATSSSTKSITSEGDDVEITSGTTSIHNPMHSRKDERIPYNPDYDGDELNPIISGNGVVVSMEEMEKSKEEMERNKLLALKCYESHAKSEVMEAEEVQKRLSKIHHKYYAAMGFKDSKPGELVDLLIRTFPIPPNNIRPSSIVHGERHENLRTKVLKEIVDLTKKLKSAMGNNNALEETKLKARIQNKIDYYFNPTRCAKGGGKGFKFKKDVATTSNFKQTMVGKEGRFRKDLMGFRLDYCSRCPIVEDFDIRPDELGVPQKTALTITYPEVVSMNTLPRKDPSEPQRTHTNLEELRKRVMYSIIYNKYELERNEEKKKQKRGGSVRLIHLTEDKGTGLLRFMDRMAKKIEAEGRTKLDWEYEFIKQFDRSTANFLPQGANKVIDPFGNEYNLKSERDFDPFRITVGWVVERHMKNGDVGVLNRQPSLHRLSLNGVYIRINKNPKDKTYKVHPAVLGPYNADYDGDEMNMFFPRTDEMRAEIIQLMMIGDESWESPGVNNVPFGFVQDTILGMFLLTKKDTFFNRADFMQWLWNSGIQVGNDEFIRIPQPVVMKFDKENKRWIELWTGKQLFSMILPKIKGRPVVYGSLRSNEFPLDVNFCENGGMCVEKMSNSDELDLKEAENMVKENIFKGKTMDKNKLTVGQVEERIKKCAKFWFHDDAENLVIRKGELLVGNICGDLLGKGNNNLQGIMHVYYPRDVAMEFMRRIHLLANYHITLVGYSMGMKDFLTTPREDLWMVWKMAKLMNKAKSVESDMRAKGFNEERIEETMNGLMQMIAASSAKMLPSDVRTNSADIMIECGAKGNKSHKITEKWSVGQQYIKGNRIPRFHHSQRTGFAFPHGCNSFLSRGYIFHSHLRGLSPFEGLISAKAGRESLKDAAMKTAEWGYIQRIMMKMFEALSVQQDGTVRNSDGTIIDFKYGGDGMDPSKLRKVRLTFFNSTWEEIETRLRWTKGDVWKYLSMLSDDQLTEEQRVIYKEKKFIESIHYIKNLIQEEQAQLKWKKEIDQLFEDDDDDDDDDDKSKGSEKESKWKKEIHRLFEDDKLKGEEKIKCEKTTTTKNNGEQWRKELEQLLPKRGQVNNNNDEEELQWNKVLEKLFESEEEKEENEKDWVPEEEMEESEKQERTYAKKLWKSYSKLLPSSVYGDIVPMPFKFNTLIPMIKGIEKLNISEKDRNGEEEEQEDEFVVLDEDEEKEKEDNKKGKQRATKDDVWKALKTLFGRLMNRHGYASIHMIAYVIEELSIKRCTLIHQFTISQLNAICNHIMDRCEYTKAATGDAVGAIAAQSVGEPSTQGTLKSYHFSGNVKTMTQGIPRFKECLRCTNNPKTPYMECNISVSDIMSSSSSSSSPNECTHDDVCKDEKECKEKKYDQDRKACEGLRVSMRKLLLRQVLNSVELLELQVEKNEDGTLLSYGEEDSDQDRHLMFFETYQVETSRLSGKCIKIVLDHEKLLTLGLQFGRNEPMEAQRMVLQKIHKVLSPLHRDFYLKKVLPNVRNLKKDNYLYIMNSDILIDSIDTMNQEGAIVYIHFLNALDPQDQNQDQDQDEDEDDEEEQEQEEEEEEIHNNDKKKKSKVLKKKNKKKKSKSKKKRKPKKDPIDKQMEVMVEFLKSDRVVVSEFESFKEVYGISDCNGDKNKGMVNLVLEGCSIQEALLIRGVDQKTIYTNDVHRIGEYFGKEAARAAMFEEISKTSSLSSIDPRHVKIIVDYMYSQGKVTPLTRFSIVESCVSILQICSFEASYTNIQEASNKNVIDPLLGPSERYMFGLPIPLGTNTPNFSIRLGTEEGKVVTNRRKGRHNVLREELYSSSSTTNVRVNLCNLFESSSDPKLKQQPVAFTRNLDRRIYHTTDKRKRQPQDSRSMLYHTQFNILPPSNPQYHNNTISNNPHPMVSVEPYVPRPVSTSTSWVPSYSFPNLQQNVTYTSEELTKILTNLKPVVDRLNASESSFDNNGSSSLTNNGDFKPYDTKQPLHPLDSTIVPSSYGYNPSATYYNPVSTTSQSDYRPQPSSLWTTPNHSSPHPSSYVYSASTTIQNTSSSSSLNQEYYDPFAPAIGFYNGKNYDNRLVTTTTTTTTTYDPLDLAWVDEYQPRKVVSFL